jgi:hypothetical protein
LFHHARREALTVLLVWAVALMWTVGCCYLKGYAHTPDSWVVRAGLAEPWQPDQLRQFLGLPDWVLWGIVVPWLTCVAVTVFYGLFGMADDDLGGDAAEEGGRGH